MIRERAAFDIKRLSNHELHDYIEDTREVLNLLLTEQSERYRDQIDKLRRDIDNVRASTKFQRDRSVSTDTSSRYSQVRNSPRGRSLNSKAGSVKQRAGADTRSRGRGSSSEQETARVSTRKFDPKGNEIFVGDVVEITSKSKKKFAFEFIKRATVTGIDRGNGDYVAICKVGDPRVCTRRLPKNLLVLRQTEV